jgi:periplasmic divalent cation tolerance protein
MTTLIIIKTTFADHKEAKKFANLLISSGYVACCHISKIESIYKWDGKICNDNEFELSLVTKKFLYSEIERIILENHSYELPQIISHEITNGYEKYISWAEDNLI